MTSIGDYCFYDCTNLTSVTVKNPSPVTITEITFSNRANATLYVPSGSKSAYHAAGYWNEFKEIIEKNMDEDPVHGDMDNDGEINVHDIQSIINLILGAKEMTEQDVTHGDMDGDGELTVYDIMELVNIILGKQ